MINICGVDYEFDKKYDLKPKELAKIHTINDILSGYWRTLALPEDFDLSHSLQKNCQYGFRGKLATRIKNFLYQRYNIYIPDYISQRIMEYLSSAERTDKYTFIFKRKFNWPEGYFSDGGKCWHSYNYSTPRLIEDNGGIWITVYVNDKPKFRAGLLNFGENQHTIFDSTGVTCDFIASFLIKDGYEIRGGGGGYYNTGRLETDSYGYQRRVFYFCNNIAIVKYTTDVTLTVSWDETGYGMQKCTKCRKSYIPKYADEHVCGYNHPIGEEYL